MSSKQSCLPLDRKDNLIITHLNSGAPIWLTDFGGDCERLIRKIISKLRKSGPTYIPTKREKGMYERIDRVPLEIVEAYANEQLKAWKSHYFDTVRPILKHTRDEHNRHLMGTLDELLSKNVDNASDRGV